MKILAKISKNKRNYILDVAKRASFATKCAKNVISDFNLTL